MTDVVPEDEGRTADEPTASRRARRGRDHEPAHAGAPSVPEGPLLSADDVREARFHATTDVPGYDQREVDAFLELVEHTLRRLEERLGDDGVTPVAAEEPAQPVADTPPPAPETGVATPPPEVPALADDEPEPVQHAVAPPPADVPAVAPEAALTGDEVRAARFPVATGRLGYVVGDVDHLLDRVATALDATARGEAPALDRAAVESARFPTTWQGGYDQDAVDALLDRAARSLPEG